MTLTASGEGSGFTGFYIDGTDEPSNRCHRTTNAWGVQLMNEFPLETDPLDFYACSGAVTDNFLSDTQYNEPAPQLDRPGVEPAADLVTFTIGGNDVGFSDVVKTCIWRLDCTNGRYRIPGTDIGGSVVNSTNARIDKLEGTLGALYLDLRDRVGAETSILTSSYPHLVGESLCGKLSFFAANERDFFRQGVDRMARRIESAAEDAGILFFDVRDTFEGHEVCGADGEWINGLSVPIAHSFHPNVDGQVGWAGAVAGYIDGLVAAGVPLDDAGFPLNPEPGVPFARVAAAPAVPEGDVLVDVGRLTVEVSEDPDCVQRFAPGQQLRVSGGGFAPGGLLELTLYAEGVESILVGSFNATGAGTVDQTITIPAGAAISDRSGLELVGGTPSGEVRVLVEQLDIVDPSHPCAASDRYEFSGFLAPIDNPPAVNGVRAGSSVPIKFSLGGDQGLDIFAPGSPGSVRVDCATRAATDAVEQLAAPGSSGLTYASGSDQYTYVWKTQQQWSGTCRRLTIQFRDGSAAYADFDFR